VSLTRFHQVVGSVPDTKAGSDSSSVVPPIIYNSPIAEILNNISGADAQTIEPAAVAGTKL